MRRCACQGHRDCLASTVFMTQFLCVSAISGVLHRHGCQYCLCGCHRYGNMQNSSSNDHMVRCRSTSGWSGQSHGTASRLQTFEQKAQQLLWQRRLLRIHNPVHTITLPIICILQLCNLLTILRTFIAQKAKIAGLIVVSRSQLLALTQAGAIAGPCWTVNSLSTQDS